MDTQKILNKAKQQILNEMEDFRSNIHSLFHTDEFIEKFGVTQDEYILQVTEKALAVKQELIDPQEKKYLWIGINPPPGKYSMLQLYEKTLAAINKIKWLKEHAFTVEGHTDGGYRAHVHMMIPKVVKPCRAIESLSRHYQVEANSIECKTGHCYNEHLKYIMGDKKNEKKINVEKDIVERNEIGISNYILSTMYNGQVLQKTNHETPPPSTCSPCKDCSTHPDDENSDS